jgi:hypothetical protein
VAEDGADNAGGDIERVTIAEAADLLGCHPNTVRSRVKAGMYRAEKFHTENGPTWFIERDSLTDSAPTSAPQQLTGGVPAAQQEAIQELARTIVREAGIARDPERERAVQELQRTRDGIMEALKLEHGWFQNLGTICLAAIAAFGAMLGGFFSDASQWDSTYQLVKQYPLVTLSVDRASVISLTFTLFIMAALASGIGTGRVRIDIREVAKADTMEELESSQTLMRRLISIRAIERLLGILFFGAGLISFIVFLGQST